MKNESLLKRLQGYFNARKEEFILALKQHGEFVEFCEVCGFIYKINITAYEKVIALEIGLKDGKIAVYQTLSNGVRKAI